MQRSDGIWLHEGRLGRMVNRPIADGRRPHWLTVVTWMRVSPFSNPNPDPFQSRTAGIRRLKPDVCASNVLKHWRSDFSSLVTKVGG